MGFIEHLLPFVKGAPLLHLFSLLLPSEQVLFEPTVEALLASLAILEAVVFIAFTSYYFVLRLLPPVPAILLAVKIVDGGLYFIPLHFYLTCLFFLFYFSIFRTTRVRGYQSRCHICHNLMA